MNNDEDKTIRVGSRKSELALTQTKHVISLLQKLYPNKKFEIHTMSTIGDRVLNVSLPKIGEKSLFTRDLEDALRTGGVDFVVHSLKDLPTALPTGMAIGAVLEREDARDALVLRENFKEFTLQTLPSGCVIGTSSLRRAAQLRRKYQHLNVCDIRGNLNTRLAKLDANDLKFSGIILAQAGLVRMGWQNRISQVLEPEQMLYAVGQGALAVECRANDNEILDMLCQLTCISTTCRILAERSFLKTLGGGCSAPVAVVSKFNGGGGGGHAQNQNATQIETQLVLEGAVWSLNGDTEISGELNCKLNMATTTMTAAGMGATLSHKRTKKNSINVGDGDGENGNNNNLIGSPPLKRTRQLSGADTAAAVEIELQIPGDNNSGDDSSSSNSIDSPKRQSPPVINDDIEVDGLRDTYNLKQLIEKHIDLAKKCPVVGHEAAATAQAKHDNGNNTIKCGGGGGGGGDADCLLIATTAAAETATYSGNVAAAQHCPLHIDVGQDFMGECPFVSNETKVSMANAGICPITGKDQLDRAAVPPSSTSSSSNAEMLSKCPFAGGQIQMQQQMQQKLAAGGEPAAFGSNNNNASTIASSHAKCPFLQKTVEMFDYKDEEKPMPRKLNKLIEDVDDLFCGLYQHRCHNRDLYVKSHRLGQQLAENLIKKGALEVMKIAQDEIHSKIS